jgi:hypothetical protein
VRDPGAARGFWRTCHRRRREVVRRQQRNLLPGGS